MIVLSGCTAAAGPTADTHAVIVHGTPPRPTMDPNSVCAALAGNANFSTEWRAAVCPAFDQLIATQQTLRNLQQAAQGLRQLDVIRLAAAANQALTSVKYALEQAPLSEAGDGIVKDFQSAVIDYQNAVDQLRLAMQSAAADPLHEGVRLMASGDSKFKRALANLTAADPSGEWLARYNEFSDHVKLALKQAYAQADQLRVAHNLVNDAKARSVAEDLAAWGQEERNWLIDHPTAPCYTAMKEHWLDWVVMPVYNLAEAYTRWAKLWPVNDQSLWSDLSNHIGEYANGRSKFAAELKKPTQTCVSTTAGATP